jgi:hypothetical protein
VAGAAARSAGAADAGDRRDGWRRPEEDDWAEEGRRRAQEDHGAQEDDGAQEDHGAEGGGPQGHRTQEDDGAQSDAPEDHGSEEHPTQVDRAQGHAEEDVAPQEVEGLRGERD